MRAITLPAIFLLLAAPIAKAEPALAEPLAVWAVGDALEVRVSWAATPSEVEGLYLIYGMSTAGPVLIGEATADSVSDVVEGGYIDYGVSFAAGDTATKIVWSSTCLIIDLRPTPPEYWFSCDVDDIIHGVPSIEGVRLLRPF